jgi:hypothetical protein
MGARSGSKTKVETKPGVMDVLFNKNVGTIIHTSIENIAKVDPVQTLCLVDGRPSMKYGCLIPLIRNKAAFEPVNLRKQGDGLLIREVFGHDQVAPRQKDGLRLQVFVMSGAEHELVARVVSLDLSDHGVKAKYFSQGTRANIFPHAKNGQLLTHRYFHLDDLVLVPQQVLCHKL